MYAPALKSVQQRRSPYRTPCEDSDKFQPLFQLAERDLKSGVRKTLRFGRDASIEAGNYFIVGGQLAYVAEIGESHQSTANRRKRCALARQYIANGTESNLLRCFVPTSALQGC